MNTPPPLHEHWAYQTQHKQLAQPRWVVLNIHRSTEREICLSQLDLPPTNSHTSPSFITGVRARQLAEPISQDQSATAESEEATFNSWAPSTETFPITTARRNGSGSCNTPLPQAAVLTYLHLKPIQIRPEPVLGSPAPPQLVPTSAILIAFCAESRTVRLQKWSNFRH